MSPVVGVQDRALALLDAETWSSGRGAAGGAESRGSRVASILESLPPGSGLQGWFQALDGNQVAEILCSLTLRRAGRRDGIGRRDLRRRGGMRAPLA